MKQLTTQTYLSPAKINLFLHVYQQRSDGYHNLHTYFQFIDLCDEITVTSTDDNEIHVDNPAIDIPVEKDLCYLAAKKLQAYADKPVGASISVDKKIPDGGGLGGGSSNAATVLLALNQLWKLDLPTAELLSIGLTLGSDVPIFIHGHSSFAQGRGEIFSQTNVAGLAANQSLILVKPAVYVSTPEIFQSPLLTKRPDNGKIRDLDAKRGWLELGNDFQAVVFTLYPEIADSAKCLSAFSTAYLTGTGACLYAVLDDAKKADTITRTLGRDYQVFHVKALEKSPLIK